MKLGYDRNSKCECEKGAGSCEDNAAERENRSSEEMRLIGESG
jgi:hypothetical protein